MATNDELIGRMRSACDPEGGLSSLADRAVQFLQYVAREELLALCARIAHSQPALERLAANSYRHALGFNKMILLSDRPFGQLRLHVWSADDARKEEHVHDHRFDFASLVLSGELVAYSYREAGVGDPHDRFIENATPDERRWSFVSAGSCYLALDSVVRLTAGSSHCLASEGRHRLEAAKGVRVVTLFLETQSVRSSTNVYVPPGANVVEGPQERLTPAAVKRQLAEVMAELS